jgi:uncharacterized protein YigA (DUF484 family)
VTQKPKDAAAGGEKGLRQDQVVAYLKRHPDFLAEHTELFDHLLASEGHRGEGVIDLQSVMIKKLRREAKRLRKRQTDLLATSRANMTSQMRVHAAALALLDARSFEELIEAVTTDLAVHMDVDVVVMCIESSDEAPVKAMSGIFIIEPGEVDRQLGAGRDIVLSRKDPELPEIYGAAASLVQSEALLRLRPSLDVPTGMLALGSRYEGRFDPYQGTELMGFLSRTLEHCIRTWLGLKSTR